MKKQKLFMGLLIAGLLGLSASVFASPIAYTITGTATSSDLGYVSGNSYSFTFLFNDAYLHNPMDSFDADSCMWQERDLADSALFSDVDGDGLTGSLVRPASPVSYALHTEQTPGVTTLTAVINEGGADTGLTANGINSVIAFYLTEVKFNGSWAYPGSYISPTESFGNNVGTYAANSGTLTIYNDALDGVVFNATQVSVDVVPEPSTILLLGIGAVVLRGARRFNRPRR